MIDELAELLRVEPHEVYATVEVMIEDLADEGSKSEDASIEDLKTLVLELLVQGDQHPAVAEHRRLTLERLAPRPGRFRRGVKRALGRGRDWMIPEAAYLSLIERGCAACGAPIGRDGVGLWITDGSKAYRESNVEPCCGPCNMARSRQIMILDQEQRLKDAEMAGAEPKIDWSQFRPAPRPRAKRVGLGECLHPLSARDGSLCGLCGLTP